MIFKLFKKETNHVSTVYSFCLEELYDKKYKHYEKYEYLNITVCNIKDVDFHSKLSQDIYDMFKYIVGRSSIKHHVYGKEYYIISIFNSKTDVFDKWLKDNDNKILLEDK